MKSLSTCALLTAILVFSVLSDAQQTSVFAPAIPDWQVPTAKPAALLLAFDTDPSLNRMSYSKFYDHDPSEFFPQPQCRYQTVMWTRSADSVRLAASLPIVACPRKSGFLYAGFAGYTVPPKPDAGKPLESSGEDHVPSFADCSGVWQTSNPEKIGQAIKDREHELARGECSRTQQAGGNMTEDWRISFITPKVLALRKFEAVITGGATYFTASEDDWESDLNTGKNLQLSDIVSAAAINRVFRDHFRREHRVALWGLSEEALAEWNFARNAGFTLEDLGGEVHLMGLHSAAGNAEREFLESVDLGIAPSSLANFPDSGLDFSRFKKIDPKTVAVFTAPDKATVFVLTAESMIAIDVKTKSELLNARHGVRFNRIIMTEWAEGDNTVRWENQLGAVNSQLPASLSCRR